MLLPKARLAARVLAAESQLATELNRSGGRKHRHRFTTAFRLLWVVLSRVLDGWEELVHLMKPETVKRWHTRAFQLFWRWRSRPGRPPISEEMQQLIRRLSGENPLWGPDRIRDTLLLLGYEAPCAETIRKYMVRPRKPRSPSCAPQQCYPGLLGDFVLLRADGILSPMMIGASLLLGARCVLRAIWELICHALRFHVPRSSMIRTRMALRRSAILSWALGGEWPEWYARDVMGAVQLPRVAWLPVSALTWRRR